MSGYPDDFNSYAYERAGYGQPINSDEAAYAIDRLENFRAALQEITDAAVLILKRRDLWDNRMHEAVWEALYDTIAHKARCEHYEEVACAYNQEIPDLVRHAPEDDWLSPKKEGA